MDANDILPPDQATDTQLFFLSDEEAAKRVVSLLLQAMRKLQARGPFSVSSAPGVERSAEEMLEDFLFLLVTNYHFRSNLENLLRPTIEQTAINKIKQAAQGVCVNGWPTYNSTVGPY